jgi:hypothetical protein
LGLDSWCGVISLISFIPSSPFRRLRRHAQHDLRQQVLHAQRVARIAVEHERDHLGGHVATALIQTATEIASSLPNTRGNDPASDVFCPGRRVNRSRIPLRKETVPHALLHTHGYSRRPTSRDRSGRRDRPTAQDERDRVERLVRDPQSLAWQAPDGPR